MGEHLNCLLQVTRSPYPDISQLSVGIVVRKGSYIQFIISHSNCEVRVDAVQSASTSTRSRVKPRLFLCIFSPQLSDTHLQVGYILHSSSALRLPLQAESNRNDRSLALEGTSHPGTQGTFFYIISFPHT